MAETHVPVVRIYTGDDGESHFEDLAVPLRDLGAIGCISERIPASGLLMRTTGADYDFDFHNAPRRQYVINLDGPVELEVGDGTRRVLEPGDVLLAEDTTGRGHKSRAVDGRKRRSIFVTLD